MCILHDSCCPLHQMSRFLPFSTHTMPPMSGLSGELRGFPGGRGRSDPGAAGGADGTDALGTLAGPVGRWGR